MKTKNIFIFWIGDSQKINRLTSQIENAGFNVVVGPTKDEHEFLYKKYPYYRTSYDKKIWSFCSDVWRVYVLSKYEGLYIDTSVIVGPKFNEFFERNICKKVTLFKETSSSIASSVMFSGEENNKFFVDLLKIYEGDCNENPRLNPILPDILSAYTCEKIDFYGFDEIITGKLSILSLNRIRNKNEIIKIGTGSWMSDDKVIDMNNLVDDNFWKKANDFWDKKYDYELFKRKWHKYISMAENPISPTPQGLREAYEKSNSKIERKKIIAAYKKLNYKIDFVDKLIWSKLYLLFSMKRAKEK